MDQTCVFFRKNQYVLLDNFLPAVECRKILDDVDRYRKSSTLIHVDQTTVTSRKKFLTLNGEEMEAHIPAAVPLYDRVHDLVNQLSGKEYAALDNKKIGLSINITPAGGTFSWHHDRHEITAILYLNEVDAGGELEFFADNRFLLKNYRQGFRKWLQLGCDAVGLVVSMVTRPRIKVVPKPGVMCVMIGTRCTHRVRPVIGDRDRICMIFAYDVPGKDFSREMTADYYGYK